MTTCQFLHGDDDDNDDAKAIAIPRVFSENSPANQIPKYLDFIAADDARATQIPRCIFFRKQSSLEIMQRS